MPTTMPSTLMPSPTTMSIYWLLLTIVVPFIVIVLLPIPIRLFVVMTHWPTSTIVLPSTPTTMLSWHQFAIVYYFFPPLLFAAFPLTVSVFPPSLPISRIVYFVFPPRSLPSCSLFRLVPIPLASALPTMPAILIDFSITVAVAFTIALPFPHSSSLQTPPFPAPSPSSPPITMSFCY